MTKKQVKRTKRVVQNRTSLTRVKWEKAFLDALRESGVVRAACEASKVPRSTATSRRKSNARFAALWDDALDDFADTLETEAVRRARDGIIKGIYHQGILTSTELQYSDTLMTQMLKAKRPDQYGEKLVIKIDPDQVALLKKLNMSPSDAFNMLMQELSNANADAATNSD